MGSNEYGLQCLFYWVGLQYKENRCWTAMQQCLFFRAATIKIFYVFLRYSEGDKWICFLKNLPKKDWSLKFSSSDIWEMLNAGLASRMQASVIMAASMSSPVVLPDTSLSTLERFPAVMFRFSE